jgi:hypothetical protein
VEITSECLTQIQLVNTKWKVPGQLTNTILEHLTSWLTNKPMPPMGQIATNPENISQKPALAGVVSSRVSVQPNSKM